MRGKLLNFLNLLVCVLEKGSLAFVRLVSATVLLYFAFIFPFVVWELSCTLMPSGCLFVCGIFYNVA